jgi:hypothetical protein
MQPDVLKARGPAARVECALPQFVEKTAKTGVTESLPEGEGLWQLVRCAGVRGEALEAARYLRKGPVSEGHIGKDGFKGTDDLFQRNIRSAKIALPLHFDGDLQMGTVLAPPPLYVGDAFRLLK